LLLWVTPAVAAAPAAVRSYVWHGEVIGVDQEAKTAIVKAHFRQHVLHYIDRFNPGERILVTWGPTREGEAGDIIYIEPYDQIAGGKYGYVLPVELVSVDKTECTITFKMRVPAKSLHTLKSMQTGGRVKVTTPFDQPAETPAILSVEPLKERETSEPAEGGV